MGSIGLLRMTMAGLTNTAGMNRLGLVTTKSQGAAGGRLQKQNLRKKKSCQNMDRKLHVKGTCRTHLMNI